MLEILQLSIAIVTGWQAQLLLRRAGPPQRLYAYMLLGDCALAGVAFGASSNQSATELTELLGALSIFGFVVLVLVPPILRDVARAAVERRWTRLGAWLTSLREHLQPGLGARQEREVIDTIDDVNAGRVDAVVAALREHRALAADPQIRQAIDDRIIRTFLYASRWRQAIDAFELSVAGGTGAPNVALLIEMVRAYGEAGDLDRAADLVERLERTPASHEPTFGLLFARARMLFLALVGRADAVAALLAPTGPLGQLPPASRSFWNGTALLYAGELERARGVLADAVRAAGRDERARQIAAERLLLVDDQGLVVPRFLPPAVADLADRLAAQVVAAPPVVAVPRLEGVSFGAVPVTTALIVANVLIAMLVTWRLGSTEDPLALVRAGANLKSAVRAGEWWRLHASTYLHVGYLHLGVNMLALWSLGRLVEQIFGGLRFFVIYSLAGVGGALASLLFGAAGISAGASGAVFGILGAAIVELALNRKTQVYPDRWRRALVGNLIFLAAANLGIGAAYPLIDQSAHVGGLLVGAAAAALFAPRLALGRSQPVRALAAVLAVVLGLSVAASAVLVVTTSSAATLTRVGWIRHSLGGVSVELPGTWLVDADEPASAQDPTWSLKPNLTVDIVPAAQLPGVMKVVEDDLKKTPSVGQVTVVEPTFAGEIPAAPAAPWRTHELRFAFQADGGTWWFRKAVFLRADGDRAISFALFVPEARLDAARPIVARLLESARLE